MPPGSPPPRAFNLFSLVWDHATSSLTVSISFWILIVLLVVLLVLAAWRRWAGGFTLQSFEIDQAEIGVGASKFRFRPNLTDRQVAYAIWIELSTRKIGLPIDLEHDVVSEIYDSWYNFFSVTRELVKTVPASQVKRGSTQAIIKLSIEVLNQGLRPHLTQWQARFRSWYQRELKRYEEAKDSEVLDPQIIQAKFPQFQELKADLLRVNQHLIRYREKMSELIMRD